MPATTPPRPGQIKPLTSVRVFAALYVAAYHLVHPFSQWGPLGTFFSAGYTAVSFFFVLSGFILTYTYGADFEAGRADRKRFWIARFARIYPVYLVCTLFAGYVCRAQFRPAFHALAFVSDLVMLQSWSVRMSPFFNVPGWSLSVEAFFYTLFPWLVLRLRPARPRQAVGMVAILWLLALIAPVIGVCLDSRAGWHEILNESHPMLYAIRRYPVFALPEFAAGIVLGWFHLRFRLQQRTATALLVCGVAGTLASLAESNHLPFELLHNGLLIPFYCLIILGLCYPGIIARGLSWAPLLLLGEASYALYLFHYNYNGFVLQRFHVPESLGGLAFRMLVIVPVSIALHLYVERPGRRRILKLWATRRGAASAK